MSECKIMRSKMVNGNIMAVLKIDNKWKPRPGKKPYKYIRSMPSGTVRPVRIARGKIVGLYFDKAVFPGCCVAAIFR